MVHILRNLIFSYCEYFQQLKNSSRGGNEHKEEAKERHSDTSGQSLACGEPFTLAADWYVGRRKGATRHTQWVEERKKEEQFWIFHAINYIF